MKKMMEQQRKDRLSLFALISANLLPLAGIFLFGWDISFIVLLYWVENLVVGFYNILKMAFLRIDQGVMNVTKLFYIPFFCIHYGGFCAVHGVFLSTFFKIGAGASVLNTETTWWGPLIFLQLLYAVVSNLWVSRPPEMIWAVIGLFISHGVSFVENFLLGGEYAASRLDKLMHQPYRRIIVMHIAILAGGVFIMKFDSPLILMVLLVLLKIAFDLQLHRKSHEPAKEKKTKNKKNGRESSLSADES